MVFIKNKMLHANIQIFQKSYLKIRTLTECKEFLFSILTLMFSLLLFSNKSYSEVVSNNQSGIQKNDFKYERVVTPVYKPDLKLFKPPLGVYTYVTSWQGIPAAEATLKIEKINNKYKVNTEVKTYSVIDIFYKLRFYAESIIAADSLHPESLNINQFENSKKKSITVNFSTNGEIYSKRVQKNGEIKEEKFNTNNMTLDPYSAVFMARSLPWNIGVSRDFDVYNGKTRYIVTLKVSNKIKMDVNGEDKEVWVIIPKVSNLTNMKENNKLREAKIYVTADENKDIVKIWSSVFIGAVTSKLTKFSPQISQNQ